MRTEGVSIKGTVSPYTQPQCDTKNKFRHLELPKKSVFYCIYASILDK